MGICFCLQNPSSSDSEGIETADKDLMRHRMLQAAEQRRTEQESRGLKDLEGYKKKQQKLEKFQNVQPNHNEETGLRWQVG